MHIVSKQDTVSYNVPCKVGNTFLIIIIHVSTCTCTQTDIYLYSNYRCSVTRFTCTKCSYRYASSYNNIL